MTLVVTHAQGFLGCFTVEPDGSMRQRALIDTGEQPPSPQELAELGTTLADHWGWELNGSHIKVNPPPKEKQLPADPVKALKETERQRRQSKPRKYTRTVETIPQRKDRICGYLAEHPDSSLSEILVGLGHAPSVELQSRWHHQMKDLVRDGRLRLIKRPSANGGRHLNTYRLAD